MGRPPCCDMVVIKKGPWTRDEDIILVSYVQEHGPGNWRHVPINTGLMRAGKSLRWTNYLRPGIRHGNFTPHEDGVIVDLQSLLGNKWAAIASYLPRRTDNDIKNYWNTNLKKKLEKRQAIIGAISVPPPIIPTTGVTQLITRRRLLATTDGESSLSSYPFSMDNISKLLNDFVKNSPLHDGFADIMPLDIHSLLSLDHMSGSALPLISDVPPMPPMMPQQVLTGQGCNHEPKQQQKQLSSIENWLFDEPNQQLMETGCCSVPVPF